MLWGRAPPPGAREYTISCTSAPPSRSRSHLRDRERDLVGGGAARAPYFLPGR